MSSLTVFGTRIITGGPDPMPRRNNDNMRLMPDWQTPAEFLQWIRREKERLRRDRVANPQLLACPEHRLAWQIRLAMEKVCLWHHCGQRQG